MDAAARRLTPPCVVCRDDTGALHGIWLENRIEIQRLRCPKCGRTWDVAPSVPPMNSDPDNCGSES